MDDMMLRLSSVMAKVITHSKELIEVENDSAEKGSFKDLVANKKSKKPNFQRLPQSTVMSRVQGFLPAIASANKSLMTQQDKGGCDTNDMNIESVGDGDAHVAMEIALVDVKGSEWSASDEEDDSNTDSDDANIKTIELKTKSITEDNLIINKTLKNKTAFKPDMIKEIVSGSKH